MALILDYYGKSDATTLKFDSKVNFQGRYETLCLTNNILQIQQNSWQSSQENRGIVFGEEFSIK